MTLYFGWGVFAALSLASLVAVVVGFTFRVDIVEARLVRSRPGWMFVVLFVPVVAVAFWSGYARHSSWQAHILGYCAATLLLGFMAMIFRPVLPVILVVGGVAGNFLVMAANGLRMPSPGSCDGEGMMYTCISDSTRLWWLADVIPLDVQGSLVMSAISPGDILLTIGFALVAARVWIPLKRA